MTTTSNKLKETLYAKKTVYDKIYSIIEKILVSEFNEKGNFAKVGRNPEFSDLSIITFSLVSEALGIDSENYLFGKLAAECKNDFPNLINRSQYNLGRRKLKSGSVKRFV